MVVPCCCNNMFMVFQLLQPNVSAVVLCCCNNMFMVFQLFYPNGAAVAPCLLQYICFIVFQLLQPNVVVVVFVLLHVFYSSFLCCSVGEGPARLTGA